MDRMGNKAVFLDRDGTINIDKGYIYRKEDFQFIDGSIDAIKQLKENNYKIIVVTNQSGVARGYYNEDDVIELHKYINKKLEAYDCSIDAFYYCPHHPNALIDKYKINCSCRKPKSGMLELAVKEFNLIPEECWMIGDKESDITAGKKLKMRTVLISKEKPKTKTTLISESLYEATKFII